MALASAPRVESVGGKGCTAAVSAGGASIADANVLENEREKTSASDWNMLPLWCVWSSYREGIKNEEGSAHKF